MRERQTTLVGLSVKDVLTSAEARALWEHVQRQSEEIEHLRQVVESVRPGMIALSGPRHLRLQGPWLGVVLVVALVASAVVAYRWAPQEAEHKPRVQTHGGR